MALEQAVLLAHMQRPGRVLVVGCGAGREAFALEALGWDVVGVDVTPRMVQVACEDGRARASQVRFEVTDGTLDDAAPGPPVDAVTLWAQVPNNVVGALLPGAHAGERASRPASGGRCQSVGARPGQNAPQHRAGVPRPSRRP